MFGIVLAIVAATSWGASAVLARVGLQQMRTATGTVVSLLSSAALVILITLMFRREALFSVSTQTVLWFAGTGVLNFPMGRYFNYAGLARIGISRSTPVLSAGPLFATTFAAIFVKEPLTPPLLVALFCIMAGLYIALSKRTEPPRDPNPSALTSAGIAPLATSTAQIATRVLVLGYLFSFMAAASYGGAQVMTRYGVSHLAEPLVGASISFFFGTLILAGLTAPEAFAHPHLAGKAILFMTLSGISSAVGVLAMYEALRIAPVAVVAPIISINPLITFFFAYLFLRGMERITVRILVGTSLVVLGVIIVSLAKAVSS